MTKFINANPASRSRWPTPSCRSPTTSAMGKIIWMLGFSSRASWRKSCTARCWSIWYRLFIATLLFFLAEKLPSVIMTGVESRYFLRTNGHPLRRKIRRDAERSSRCALASNMDVEELVERILRAMEDVAGEMVDSLTHELVEVIQSTEVLDISQRQFQGHRVDLLPLVLHSLLMPVRARSGTSVPLTF